MGGVTADWKRKILYWHEVEATVLTSAAGGLGWGDLGSRPEGKLLAFYRLWI
jgi:hypothetical protein